MTAPQVTACIACDGEAMLVVLVDGVEREAICNLCSCVRCGETTAGGGLCETCDAIEQIDEWNFERQAGG